ncbi:hypothetical protein B0T22DRAFT_473889 [Podospora appendiculata]|uniref:Uncharacterized protein n=1 Tax=Podospora appendiculata TaxID=314037 RepID=A0AAE0WZ67_9PEZI|nr:hypothetical protein B0T22DRAFT_473889 [Podospora appendiculata]
MAPSAINLQHDIQYGRGYNIAYPKQSWRPQATPQLPPPPPPLPPWLKTMPTLREYGIKTGPGIIDQWEVRKLEHEPGASFLFVGRKAAKRIKMPDMTRNLAIAPGGLIEQPIIKDPRLFQWSTIPMSTFKVHIVESQSALASPSKHPDGEDNQGHKEIVYSGGLDPADAGLHSLAEHVITNPSSTPFIIIAITTQPTETAAASPDLPQSHTEPIQPEPKPRENKPKPQEAERQPGVEHGRLPFWRRLRCWKKRPEETTAAGGTEGSKAKETRP